MAAVEFERKWAGPVGDRAIIYPRVLVLFAYGTAA